LSQDRLAPLGAVIELANDMLAALENLPQTPDGWNRFSWDHRNSHDRIRAAIKTKYGADLSDYQVDPIDSNAIGDFLQNNSQLHGDMNGVLGLQSSDLQDVNFGDKPQFEAWVRLHYLEHQQAELKLEI
jgi:hypothetical protein